MKSIFQSVALLTISVFLFNCSNTNEPVPSANSQTAAVVNSDELSNAKMGVNMVPIKQEVFRLVQTLTMPQGKGFNLTSPFAITSESGGDIGWGAYGCYAALKPVKVSFSNLKIVDIASVTPTLLSTLPFNQSPIANAPAGSAFWTNYMPVKTVIACKTAAGKYYLIEVLGDNPLKVNIYHPVRPL
ncbi:hypothetical protein [Dyadobacter luticola]|uniref:Uncharacterized protein n=1 Tax=Dyadobacter luticola TaxID=1979387 RepID=A0A5R9KW84_9BACT|nr:hypothetical protein [Dyadobacter luticola]TLV00431.1 hypothetical protein FEN17_13155 [Dyadobacter luticola]